MCIVAPISPNFLWGLCRDITVDDLVFTFASGQYNHDLILLRNKIFFISSEMRRIDFMIQLFGHLIVYKMSYHYNIIVDN